METEEDIRYKKYLIVILLFLFLLTIIIIVNDFLQLPK